MSKKAKITTLATIFIGLFAIGGFFLIQNAPSGAPEAPEEPSTSTPPTDGSPEPEAPETPPEQPNEPPESPERPVSAAPAVPPSSALSAHSSTNCTLNFGTLALINPNFTVSTDFIAARRSELVDISALYGIREHNYWNGTPLLDAEAARHLSDLTQAYSAANPGHSLWTMSCFRSVGTNCGRLCYATGTSDHHSGYTCDLIDPSYGTVLDTDDLPAHLEWHWLKEHSFEYGFIDRFPVEWAGGPMTQPVNITAEGSTGLYETWHYRYVGLTAASEIASGKYNNGAYDSLEHYLLATGRVSNLLSATCKE